MDRPWSLTFPVSVSLGPFDRSFLVLVVGNNLIRAVAVGKVTRLDGVCPMHLFAKSQRYSVHNPTTPLPSTPLVFD